MMKTIQTGFVCEDEEKKYDSDNEDQAVWQNGFSTVRKPKFSTKSILSSQDVVTQQMIFNRLPLSQSNRAIFFKWLLAEEKKKNNELAPDKSASGSNQGDDARVQTAVPDS